MVKRNQKKLPKAKGIKRILNATRYSFSGICVAFRYEIAFRQEVLLACVLLPCVFSLPLQLNYKVLLISSMIIILIVELINSGIETIVDMVSPEYHEHAKQAKDLGSAAVLFSQINLFIVACFAFFSLSKI